MIRLDPNGDGPDERAARLRRLRWEYFTAWAPARRRRMRRPRFEHPRYRRRWLSWTVEPW